MGAICQTLGAFDKACDRHFTGTLDKATIAVIQVELAGHVVATLTKNASLVRLHPSSIGGEQNQSLSSVPTWGPATTTMTPLQEAFVFTVKILHTCCR